MTDTNANANRDRMEAHENARLAKAYEQHKCFVVECDDVADHVLEDADNNGRPFLLCDTHYTTLRDGKKRR